MTHCERVLELLADGREHSHHELYALNVVAHSRVAELRGRGHTITQRRVAGADGEPDYIYRLISSPRPDAETTTAASSASGYGGERGPTDERDLSQTTTGAEPLIHVEAPRSPLSEQLSLDVAA